VTYAPPFWLSHHRSEEAYKCFNVGGLHVCSRCLGTYPVLFAALVVQLKRPLAPPALGIDPWLFFALPVPAVLDWSVGQLTRWRGNNLLRLLSGCLLGAGIGRCIYVNMRHPGDVRVFEQLLGLCAVAGIVWGIRQVLGLGAKKPEGDGPPVDPDGPLAR
jgi:uncharacterized membrane protein